MPHRPADGLAAEDFQESVMDAQTKPRTVESHEERIQMLAARRKEQKRLQTIRFDLTEQEKKEREEYIKKWNCPF